MKLHFETLEQVAKNLAISPPLSGTTRHKKLEMVGSLMSHTSQEPMGTKRANYPHVLNSIFPSMSFIFAPLSQKPSIHSSSTFSPFPSIFKLQLSPTSKALI